MQQLLDHLDDLLICEAANRVHDFFQVAAIDKLLHDVEVLVAVDHLKDTHYLRMVHVDQALHFIGLETLLFQRSVSKPFLVDLLDADQDACHAMACRIDLMIVVLSQSLNALKDLVVLTKGLINDLHFLRVAVIDHL